jgi:hypothetical protein
MANHLMPNLVQTFVDSNGDALAGGKVYTYEAGTSTPLVTYNSSVESVPNQNTNPVILDANGQANIWLKNQAYKIVLTDADDNVLVTRDNVTHIATGSIETTLLDDDSVSTIKVQNEAITTAKVDDEAITNQKIAPDAVDGTKIEDESIDSEHYVDGSIDREHLAADIVNGTKIADDSIDSEHYVDGSIDTAHLSDGVVTRGKINTYFETATVATDASLTNGETKTILDMPVTGHLVRITVYAGQLEIQKSGLSSSGVHLQYSADNSSWSTIGTLFNITTAVFTDYWRNFTHHINPDGVNVQSGAFICTHTPAAGTAYYRLLASGTDAMAINEALSILVEEL